MSATSYIGRFAPTPSGPLHFGSLVAALASYLDAHHHRGRWLVRMEDLDPPREVAGAAETILQQLRDHGLHWHGEVLYQSARGEAYQAALGQLQRESLIYPCDCSRQQLRAMGGSYRGCCRQRTEPPTDSYALRVNTQRFDAIEFADLWQGHQHWPVADSGGDFIVRRRDRLYAYQLACAVDDLAQGITHVVRGSDLLDSTPRQRLLMTLLTPGATPPQYGHIPVAVNPDGQKLSKQNLAAAIAADRAADNLRSALHWLNHPAPASLAQVDCPALLGWAIPRWDRRRIASVMTRPAPAKLD